MKIMTFFSEKGGVGKSSFAIMYASWLGHRHGVKVGLADYNDRIYGYRKAEMRNREELIALNPNSGIKPYDEEKTWPIVRATMRERNMLVREGRIAPNAAWLENEITGQDGRLRDMDVVICDFPGSLTGKEFIEVASADMLGLVVIPVEKDEMTLQSTLRLHSALKKGSWAENINYCVFLNRAELNLNSVKRGFQALGPILVRKGLPMLPDIVSRSERMAQIDKVDNIRSTFGFPDFDSPEYGKSKDLGIENLFIDITRLLDKSPDFRGTAETDLSFARAMVKRNDGRQFRGSAFPDFEI